MTNKFNEEFKNLKKMLFKQSFSNLNDKQQEAAFDINGPFVILAGAGSGKTTAIISRIVNMVNYGNAYMQDNLPNFLDEKIIEELKKAYENKLGAKALENIINFEPINPKNILAITFTNKAANELKNRLNLALGEVVSKEVWATTFHSLCARILRVHAEKLGYSNHFTIYDEEDTMKIIKECLKPMKVDEKSVTPRMVKNAISKLKYSLKEKTFPLASDVQQDMESDLEVYTVVNTVYECYKERLINADAMDFDDLIINTIKLFEKFPEVLEKYQNLFKYILVDEYQDTSYAQYILIKNLARKSKNLCVVGDDDQSIYKFRGASIRNIIDFEKNFPGAKIIRFEQNYRSTKNIINTANAIISHNINRKTKTLWTQNEIGDLIKVHTAYSEHDEANYIAEIIQAGVVKGENYSNFAILYRMNSQSNIIEKTLMRRGIPYRVFGGVRFYDRKEVRDIIAYLSVINNPLDEIRLKRIINQPRRSIGERTIAQASELAREKNKDLLSIMRECEKYESLQRVSIKLKAFSNLIDDLIATYNSGNISISELYEIVLEKTGYLNYLKFERDKYESKIENVQEFLSNIKRYEEEKGKDATLSGFLEEISLFTDIDNYDKNSDAVILMTLHASKGLEFPNVFLPGFEEGVFPSGQSLINPEDIEEERRLAYVGVTRCKKSLYILNSDSRMLFGTTFHNKASRFLSEIPDDFIEKTKSRDWKDLKEGESIPKSAQELRAQSVIAAHNFGGIAAGRFKAASDSKSCIYQYGDKVHHSIFGEGEVQSYIPMGNDALLDINFVNVGMKKLMASYARLEKR